MGTTRSKKTKAQLIASLLSSCTPAERVLALHYLTGSVPQGKIGVGWKLVGEIDAPAAASPALTLSEVDAALTDLAQISGKGSVARREAELNGLYARATPGEQAFLSQLLTGELRQGALEGIMVDAIAEAAAVSVDSVRRAWMLGGELALVGVAAFRGGADALRTFELRVMSFVRPMLAKPLEDKDALFVGGGTWRMEAKLDGARVQAHKQGDKVRLFSRSGRDMGHALPEIVDAVRRLPAAELVLDGEALSLDSEGRPLPFQATMRRIGRRERVDAAAARQPATARFFDVLYCDGESLIERPLRERMTYLARCVPETQQVQAMNVESLHDAQDYFEQILRAGHEGAMLKALDSTYELGNRGGAWMKWKPVHSIELVVLAAEWGSGRRRGKLSNLHLGARDGEGFAMVGKTFKGLTDARLEWQTEQLRRLQTRTEGHVVHVRPELVVEIAFDGVQRSPRYSSGVALRFARVKRYRDDVRAPEVETLDALRSRLPPAAPSDRS